MKLKLTSPWIEIVYFHFEMNELISKDIKNLLLVLDYKKDNYLLQDFTLNWNKIDVLFSKCGKFKQTVKMNLNFLVLI